jgi:hypothetical protein
MLGTKVMELSRIKSKAEEASLLEGERAALFEQLKASFSPEVARQVEDVFDETRAIEHQNKTRLPSLLPVDSGKVTPSPVTP